MKHSMQWLFLILVFLVSTVVGAQALNPYPTTDKRHYLSEKQLQFIRPGLVLSVGPEDVTIGTDGTLSVTFSITDPEGLPLDREGVFTPGEVTLRFLIAAIPADGDQYQNYITRTQTSPITGDSAIQPTSDSGGSYEALGEGVYRYTFGNQLPTDFDANATHTLGIYADRDLSEFELGENVVNSLVHFVPAGGDPAPREVVRTEACNGCHDPLAIHGGVRRETGLCILCHTEGVIDPDTGNTVDFNQMIHKIHRGENLPSVENGVPYQIIGFRQSVHDYSSVVFPQDLRNCESCHTLEATQSARYIEQPTMNACGSCHDDVDFQSGENHVGGPQISDNFCANCHFPEGELEFDTSVIGSHTIPSKSNQLEGFNIVLNGVSDTAPGENPTVRFSIVNDAGDPIAIESLNRLALNIAGPNEDFSFLARENVSGAVQVGDNEYAYTFATALPEDAMGSYTVGAEGRRDVTLYPGTTIEMSIREAEDQNPTLAFAVTDSEATARRVAVADEKCDSCHDNLSLHGGNRHEPDYCVICHQPGADDGARRPESEQPNQSIHFKFMIHRIHSGVELLWDYTVYGFGNNPHNYNELRYPGDLRNCETCHVNDSQQLPSLGTLPTLATENEFFSPIAPDSAACLGCHDSQQTAAHAFLNTAPFGEACSVCHGPDAEFSVDRVHARVD